MKSEFPWLLAMKIASGCLLAASASAAPVTYTFETPNFVPGEPAPLINRSPNLGDPAFQATFTSNPDTPGFLIGSNPNLVTGFSLFDTALPSVHTLTITLNMAVDEVHMDFALFEPGHLDLTSSSGSTAAATGPSSQTGHLDFSSPTPFTQFTLAGFSGANYPVLLGIDNLTMIPVPEPSALSLLAAGGLFLKSRRQR